MRVVRRIEYRLQKVTSARPLLDRILGALQRGGIPVPLPHIHFEQSPHVGTSAIERAARSFSELRPYIGTYRDGNNTEVSVLSTLAAPYRGLGYRYESRDSGQGGFTPRKRTARNHNLEVNVDVGSYSKHASFMLCLNGPGWRSRALVQSDRGEQRCRRTVSAVDLRAGDRSALPGGARMVPLRPLTELVAGTQQTTKR